MNKEQIIVALKAGNLVHWHNTAYKLVLDDQFDSGVGVINIHNNHYSPLLDCECNDCFLAV